MKFNDHSAIAGSHSFLSPSYYHWLNYDLDKLTDRFTTQLAAARGTELHEFAQKAIEMGIKLPSNGLTLNSYVNDAIGFKMTPEQPLMYSFNCFGTADAISFRKTRNRKKPLLRIHDLKTGISKTSELQLYIYCAIFCLEYDMKPFDIDMECRIYQNDEVRIYVPEADEIAHIMSTIITFDKKIDELKERIE